PSRQTDRSRQRLLRPVEAFQAARSARVPAFHHNGIRRGRPPFVDSARSRRCGRPTSITTSWTCKSAISETRSPQQQARHEVALCIGETLALRVQVSQTRGQFAAGQDAGGVQVPDGGGMHGGLRGCGREPQEGRWLPRLQGNNGSTSSEWVRYFERFTIGSLDILTSMWNRIAFDR